MDKVPYVPSNKKRFEISDDFTSRERIYNLLELYKKINETFSEIEVAFSLFGSLAKGKKLSRENRKSADLDLVVYYNANTLQDDVVWDSYLKKNTYLLSEYESELKKKAQSFFRVDEPTKNDLNEVERLFKKEIRNYLFEKCLKKIVGLINDTGVSIFLENFSSNTKEKPEEYLLNLLINKSPFETSEDLLFALFGLDIGGGCKKYIQRVLVLIKKRDDSEKLWQEIRRGIIKWEGRENSNKSILDKYPKTFEDACKYYGIK